MNHLSVVRMPVSLWNTAGQASQVEDLIVDYLRRDLLNKILGNSDNHGRNTSIIHGPDHLRLAPGSAPRFCTCAQTGFGATPSRRGAFCCLVGFGNCVRDVFGGDGVLSRTQLPNHPSKI